LFYSSCTSGAVSNWVGVKSECSDAADLHCQGVPWATTPYVGKDGECTASGTTFGAYGTEASRVPWRIGMDFAIYPEWATKVEIYDRAGDMLKDTVFNGQTYLNRMAYQYKTYAKPEPNPVSLSGGYTPTAPGLTCEGVPKEATANWWASMMSYPTFVAFVAPADGIQQWEAQQWMDVLVGLCDLGTMVGKFCDMSYFGVSQEVIATMVMSGTVKKGGPPPPPADGVEDELMSVAAIYDGKHSGSAVEAQPQLATTPILVLGSCLALTVAASTTMLLMSRRPKKTRVYEQVVMIGQA